MSTFIWDKSILPKLFNDDKLVVSISFKVLLTINEIVYLISIGNFGD